MSQTCRVNLVPKKQTPIDWVNFSIRHEQEMNRRMHNQLFVLDNRMAIVDGRNMGNNYFCLSKTYNFRDLD